MSRGFRFATAFLATIALQSPCLADGAPGAFDRVEEDWQLVIDSADVEGVGPQVTTCMSPNGDIINTPFVAFDMNYREYPSFSPGGMQIQVWSGDELLNIATQGTGQFQTDNETITWTQRMSVAGGSINYAVVNGQSATFGAFGQDGGPLHATFLTSLTSLAGYDPDSSVHESGVSWESDHVTSMTLMRVRYYLAGVLIYTDTQPRRVQLGNDDPEAL
jgi:hypothetical protein